MSSKSSDYLYKYRRFSLDPIYPGVEEELIPTDSHQMHKMFAAVFPTGHNRIMMCGGGSTECRETGFGSEFEGWTTAASMTTADRNMPGVAKKGQNQVWVTGGFLGFIQCK